MFREFAGAVPCDAKLVQAPDHALRMTTSKRQPHRKLGVSPAPHRMNEEWVKEDQRFQGQAGLH